jgi:hypothetical protein
VCSSSTHELASIEDHVSQSGSRDGVRLGSRPAGLALRKELIWLRRWLGWAAGLSHWPLRQMHVHGPVNGCLQSVPGRSYEATRPVDARQMERTKSGAQDDRHVTGCMSSA